MQLLGIGHGCPRSAVGTELPHNIILFRRWSCIFAGTMFLSGKCLWSSARRYGHINCSSVQTSTEQWNFAFCWPRCGTVNVRDSSLPLNSFTRK